MNVGIISSPEETKEQFAIRSALHWLRVTLKDPTATYRSPEQQELIENTFGACDNIVAVIPTGGGKSLAWEVVVQSETNTHTVVFTPFLSLIRDQLRRAEALGIKAMHWKAHNIVSDDTQLVFLSWETCNKPQVTRYVLFI